MTDIKWGPAIAVDGKRPEWLGDDDKIRWYSSNMGDAWWDNLSHRGYVPVGRLAFDREIHSIRLPADHPHYRQTEAAIPEGMTAWDGGPTAPTDWPRFGRVQFRNGEFSQGATEYNWKHLSNDYDIVAYTPQADTKPDLTAELEDLGQRLAALSKRHEALAERVARMPQPATIRTMDLRLDPDLIEARKLAAAWSESQDVGHSHYLDGHMDDSSEVRGMKAALARGRALALAGEKEA